MAKFSLFQGYQQEVLVSRGAFLWPLFWCYCWQDVRKYDYGQTCLWCFVFDRKFQEKK